MIWKIHRFNDSELLQDAYKSLNGEAIDIEKYGKTEHDLAYNGFTEQ